MDTTIHTLLKHYSLVIDTLIYYDLWLILVAQTLFSSDGLLVSSTAGPAAFSLCET